MTNLNILFLQLPSHLTLTLNYFFANLHHTFIWILPFLAICIALTSDFYNFRSLHHTSQLNLNMFWNQSASHLPLILTSNSASSEPISFSAVILYVPVSFLVDLMVSVENSSPLSIRMLSEGDSGSPSFCQVVLGVGTPLMLVEMIRLLPAFTNCVSRYLLS